MYGEDLCNQLLKSFSQRIVETFTNAVVSKASVDNFVVLYKAATNFDEINDLLESITRLLKEPINVAAEVINITCSIGVLIYPTGGTTYKDIMANLELAKFVAKKDGGDRYVIFDDEVKEKEESNLAFFNEVRRAANNNEFCLLYQPIINIKDKTIFGFESFLRWNHPSLGMITPEKFMNILIESGDINYITKWGVEQLIKKMLDVYRETGNDTFCMTQNLSPTQLMSETIVDEMRKVINHYHFNPNRIVLEVLEYSMYDKVEIIRRNLLKLRDLGFRISVDGLGLDYVTLSQIQKEPIDILKLARTFVEEIDDNYMKQKFADMLVNSASELNRIVVAEGVETDEQLKYVVKNSINYVQGYFFSKPIDDQYVVSYMKEQRYAVQIDEVIYK